MSGSEDKINIVVVWRVQSKDYFGMTGLMAALEKGRLEVVKRLFGVREIVKLKQTSLEEMLWI